MATALPTPAPTKPPTVANLSLGTLTQYLGLAAVGFYLLGFVIVTAHLSKFAVENRRLFDAQYVPAGVLFAVLVGLYFSFMKLWVFEAETVMRNVENAGGAVAPSVFWGVMAVLFQILGASFWLIFLTLLISTVFMGQPVQEVFDQISVPVVFSVILFLQGTLDRRPRFRVFAFLAVDVMGIAIFILQRRHISAPTMSLFWVLVVITITLTIIIGVEQKVKAPFGIFPVVMFMLMLAGIAMYFGSQIYGKVPMALGGGKPIPVQLLVAPDSVPTVQQVLKLNSQLSDEVLLVMENQDEILVLARQQDGTEQPIRLSRPLFSGVIPHNVESQKQPSH